VAEFGSNKGPRVSRRRLELLLQGPTRETCMQRLFHLRFPMDWTTRIFTMRGGVRVWREISVRDAHPQPDHGSGDLRPRADLYSSGVLKTV